MSPSQILGVPMSALCWQNNMNTKIDVDVRVAKLIAVFNFYLQVLCVSKFTKSFHQTFNPEFANSVTQVYHNNAMGVLKIYFCPLHNGQELKRLGSVSWNVLNNAHIPDAYLWVMLTRQCWESCRY